MPYGDGPLLLAGADRTHQCARRLAVPLHVRAHGRRDTRRAARLLCPRGPLSSHRRAARVEEQELEREDMEGQTWKGTTWTNKDWKGKAWQARETSPRSGSRSRGSRRRADRRERSRASSPSRSPNRATTSSRSRSKGSKYTKAAPVPGTASVVVVGSRRCSAPATSRRACRPCRRACRRASLSLPSASRRPSLRS